MGKKRDAAEHNHQGVLLHAKGDLDGAIAAFHDALQLVAEYGEAADNLGIVFRERGDMTEAKHWLTRAVELEPNNGRFLRHLVDCEPVSEASPLLAHLNRLAYVGDGLPREIRIEALIAHAKVLNDLGRFNEAFASLERANRLKRKTIEYDEATTLGSLAAVQKTFTTQFLDAVSGSGDPCPRPLFIVGMPRSGTTLVEAMLAAHPSVRGGGELTSFELGIRSMPAVHAESSVDDLRAAVLALGRFYVATTDERAHGTERLTDKMPFNFRFVPLMHAALPHATIVHVRRNPLDVAYSCFSTHFFDNVPWAYDLAEIGRYYAAYERVMASWRLVLPPGAMVEVQYEDLVGNFEFEARRLIEACRLTWDPAALRFHENIYPVRSASQSQVRRPLYSSSVGRSAGLRAELQPFEQAFRDAL